MALPDFIYMPLISLYLIVWLVLFAVTIRFNALFPRWYKRIGLPLAHLGMIVITIIPLFHGFRYSVFGALMMLGVTVAVIVEIKKRVRLGRMYERALDLKRAGVGEITIEDLWADVSEADSQLFKDTY